MLEIRHDLAVVDLTETVALCRPGSDRRETVAHALRLPASVAGEPSAAWRTESLWRLPATLLEPRPGDLIVDAAGRRWTVVEATAARNGCRCRCRDVAVAFGLDDTVTIQRAEYGKSIGGAATVRWHDWLLVRGRIVATEIGPQPDDGDAQFSLVRAELWLAEALPLDAGHRVVAADGRRYAVDGYRPPVGPGEVAKLALRRTA